MKIKKNKKTRVLIDITVVGRNDGKFKLHKIQQVATDLIASMVDIRDFNIKVTSK